MNTKPTILAVAGLLFAAAVGETVIPISNTVGFVEVDAAADDTPKLEDSTLRQVEYPTAVGMPSFWLDCTRTNDWTFAPDGSVAKIPSLVGDRYLATDTEGGISKIAWTPRNPLWTAADGPLRGGVLDFGPKGSLRAMSFNKVGPAGSETNVLENIGTAVAVWYSAISPDATDGEGGYYGGALLGGGFGTDGTSATVKDQYVNYRATPNDRTGITTDSGRPRCRGRSTRCATPTSCGVRAMRATAGDSSSAARTGTARRTAATTTSCAARRPRTARRRRRLPPPTRRQVPCATARRSRTASLSRRPPACRRRASSR